MPKLKKDQLQMSFSTLGAEPERTKAPENLPKEQDQQTRPPTADDTNTGTPEESPAAECTEGDKEKSETNTEPEESPEQPQPAASFTEPEDTDEVTPEEPEKSASGRTKTPESQDEESTPAGQSANAGTESQGKPTGSPEAPEASSRPKPASPPRERKTKSPEPQPSVPNEGHDPFQQTTEGGNASRTSTLPDAYRAVEKHLASHNPGAPLDLDQTSTPGGWVSQAFATGLAKALQEHNALDTLQILTSSQQARTVITHVERATGARLNVVPSQETPEKEANDLEDRLFNESQS